MPNAAQLLPSFTEFSRTVLFRFPSFNLVVVFVNFIEFRRSSRDRRRPDVFVVRNRKANLEKKIIILIKK